MLWVSLIFSGVVLALPVAATLRRGKVEAALEWSLSALIAAICFLCAMLLPTAILHAFLQFLIALGCALLKTGPRPFLAGAPLAMLVAYLVGAYWADRWIERKRGENPFESVARRLDYEPVPGTVRTPPRDGTMVRDLEDLIRVGLRGHLRRHIALKALHEDYVRMFVSAPGFGVMRMVSLESALKYYPGEPAR